MLCPAPSERFLLAAASCETSPRHLCYCNIISFLGRPRVKIRPDAATARCRTSPTHPAGALHATVTNCGDTATSNLTGLRRTLGRCLTLSGRARAGKVRLATAARDEPLVSHNRRELASCKMIPLEPAAANDASPHTPEGCHNDVRPSTPSDFSFGSQIIDYRTRLTSMPTSAHRPRT